LCTVTKSYYVMIHSTDKTASSSAIAEKPNCRVDQFCPKVEDDILQTTGLLSLTTVT